MMTLRDAGLLQLLLDVLADLDVFVEQAAEVGAVGIPAAVSRAVDAETKSDRVDLLTHYAASEVCATRTCRGARW